MPVRMQIEINYTPTTIPFTSLLYVYRFLFITKCESVDRKRKLWNIRKVTQLFLILGFWFFKNVFKGINDNI